MRPFNTACFLAGGHRCLVLSLGSTLSRPGLYSAPRWGLEGFSQSLAAEVGCFGNSIGFPSTPADGVAYQPRHAQLAAPSSDARTRPTGSSAPEVSLGLAATSRNRVISEGDPKRLGGPQ